MSYMTTSNLDLFPFVPPVRYAPPVTEHVSLHCKNIARPSGGCKYYALIKLMRHKMKRFSNFYVEAKTHREGQKSQNTE